MAVQVGTGDQLIIYLPNRGQTNWSEAFRTQFAELISQHDHTGSGKGVNIIGSAIADSTIDDSKLSFVDLTPTPQTGYVLQWNGANFVPGAVSASGGISGVNAQAQSTIMNLNDTSVSLTTNSGSPANTPANELDLRINAGKFLIDGSNNSNLLLSSSTGASAADPNTKLYIQLAARSASFDAADKTTWSDIVISNPTDSGSAAVGIRFTVDDADDTNEGAGIVGVKTHATNPSMDLRFVTHPNNATESRQSMRLTDTYDANDLSNDVTLTINSASNDENVNRLGLGTDTPTRSIDVRTAGDAVLRLTNTSETGNANNSKIEFSEDSGSGVQRKAVVGYGSTDNRELYIRQEAGTDGGITIQTDDTGSNANIYVNSHNNFTVDGDNDISMRSGGDIEIKAGDHITNNDAHLLLKSGQPEWNPSIDDGNIAILATKELYLHSDEDMNFSTWNSTVDANLGLPAKEEIVTITKDGGDFKYKGDFGSPTNAYFARVYATVTYDRSQAFVYEYQADGISSYTLNLGPNISNLRINFATSFPAAESSYTVGNSGAASGYTDHINSGSPYTAVASAGAWTVDTNGDPVNVANLTQEMEWSVRIAQRKVNYCQVYAFTGMGGGGGYPVDAGRIVDIAIFRR
jgi:hypothetical protein